MYLSSTLRLLTLALFVGLVNSAAIECPFAKIVYTNADYLQIQDCSNIRSLTVSGKNIPNLSFPYLTAVTGPLVIDNCASLTNINMPMLQTVDGFLQISNNPRLKTINMPKNSTVSGYIVVNSNGALTSATIGASSAVHAIIEDNRPAKGKTWSLIMNKLVTTSGRVTVVNNTGLVSAQFNSLKKIGSDMIISNNPRMAKFSAKSQYEVGGSMTMAQNPMLSNLVVNPIHISGSLSVDTNGAKGAGNWYFAANGLTYVGGLVEIKNNGKFVGVSMASLNKIANRFVLSSNSGLKLVTVPGPFVIGDVFTVSGNKGNKLDINIGASEVTGAVSVTSNSGIRSLHLDALTKIGDNFTISGSSISILSANNTKGFTVKGMVSISKNTDFTNVNLNGLYAVATGGFSFVNNKSPTTYPFFMKSLALVRGNIDFISNPGLGTLTMNSLAVIGSSFMKVSGGSSEPTPSNFTINDNDKLVSVTVAGTNGVGQFTVGGDLVINGNAALKFVNLDGLVRLGGNALVEKNTIAQLSMNSLACADRISLANNKGLKKVDIKALQSISNAIQFAAEQGQECLMCVGSDCASCGGCVSCGSEETCTRETAAWKNTCSSNFTCPFIVEPTVDIPVSSSQPETSTSQSSSRPTIGSTTKSTQSTQQGSTTANTNVLTEVTLDEEGSAIQTSLSLVLVTCLALLAARF